MPDRPLDNIADALQNPEIAEAFRKHLKTEFSDENMEFHERMTQFAKDAQNPGISDDQLRASARQIMDRFIRPDSERQVNVSSQQVDKITQAMGGIGGASREQIGAIMDDAHHEVVKLMSKDSFARFQKTEAYKEARDGANESLDAAEKSLEQLQARERQLKLNPSLGDKARAMVTSGGMVTMIREVERQREAVEQQIRDRTQQLPITVKINGAQHKTTPKIEFAPPPPSVPLELEPGVVSRNRSNAQDSDIAPKKPSVRETLAGGKGAAKTGHEKSLSVSDSDKDASKMSVKDKVRLFEGGAQNVSGPKRGVK